MVPFVPPDEPLAVQDRHFVECVATGAAPLTDGENGLAVVETLEAAQLSRRLGRPVLLEEVDIRGRLIHLVGRGNDGATRSPLTAGQASVMAAPLPELLLPESEAG